MREKGEGNAASVLRVSSRAVVGTDCGGVRRRAGAQRTGFTILELLVASLLLGILMTVLTMIFNQSSISWRVGEASIANLDDVSNGLTAIRHESDNLYVWNNNSHALLSVWDANGNLRTRAIDASDAGTVQTSEKINRLNGKITDTTQFGKWGTETAGNADPPDSRPTYTVNVKSAGPNRQFDDYDDIWSFPDDFD